MTLQEIFDKVYTGLKGQNWQRSGVMVEGNFDCLYRCDGLKCAAGHLIPDELYSNVIEGVSFGDSMFFSEIYTALNLENDAIEFVSLLQQCHDDANDIEKAMNDIAQDYKLTIPNSD